MTAFADPGGNFASDAHRRVLAHIPPPGDDAMAFEDIAERMRIDEGSNLSPEVVTEVLKDLEADGDASQLKDGWKQSKQGHEVLSGPIATDGGRAHD